MKFGKFLTSAAVASALSVGASNALAHVYSHSFLEIDDFTTFIVEDDGMGGFVEPPTAAITGFDVGLQNVANLNGGITATIDGCAGTPSSNNCGVLPDPRVDATIASLGGAAPLENTFVAQGPGASEYAWADSVVPTSQLNGDLSGSIQTGSEAELQSGTSAGSSAELTSNTGFELEFTISGDTGNILLLDFTAILDNYVEIFPGTGLPASALANNDLQVTLIQQNGGSGFVTWSPNGTSANCLALIVTCTVTADDFDVNDQRSINAVGSDSFVDSGAFGLIISGLTDGDWSLALTTTTNTSIAQIPEPGTLLLFGLGLAGLARRLRSAS